MSNVQLDSDVTSITHGLYEDAVRFRRDLHRHPELGWTEFRTASLAAKALADAGWDVRAGADVCVADARIGLPGDDELEAAWAYAEANGGDPEWMAAMRGGMTAVVATLDGNNPGPTIGLRFDIDALPIIEESEADAHSPAREGFVSAKPGIMHACGHDAHTAIGVSVGRALATLRDRINGTVKIILQPSEEGARGAAAIVAAGVLDDVDYFLCPHVAFESFTSGEVLPGVSGFLATEKLDIVFRGREAHAGLAPEEGRNALIGAAQATLGLHAIPRHSYGNSRVNVGILEAGKGRNIIPGEATLKVELRGQTNDVLDYLIEQTRQVVAGAAGMWGLEYTVERVGIAPSASSDPELCQRIARIAAGVPGVSHVGDVVVARASDDASAMMKRVQEHGGQATYVMIGTPIPSGHHTPRFDIEEQCMQNAIDLFTGAVLDISGEANR